MNRRSIFQRVSFLAMLVIFGLSAVVGGACARGGDKPAKAATPGTGAAAPGGAAELAPGAKIDASILLTITLGHPSRQLAGVAAYVNAIKPGFGSLLVTPSSLDRALADRVGLTSLAGADLTRPVRLVVLDPKKAPDPITLVVAVKNRDQLGESVATAQGAATMRERDGWALIGTPASVEAVEKVALGPLVAAPVPTDPTLVLDMAVLLGAFRQDLIDAKNQLAANLAAMGQAGVGAILSTELAGLLSLAEGSERLVVTLTPTRAVATLDLALVPRDGSALASFTRLQKPSDHAMLGRLPAGPASVTASGHLELGPTRAAVLDMLEPFWQTLLGKAPPPAMKGLLARWFDESTGEFAASMNLGAGLSMVELFGVKNGARAEGIVRELLAIFPKDTKMTFGDLTTTLAFKPRAFTHTGVPVNEQTTTFDLDKMPADQRKAIERLYGDSMKTYITAFDDVMLVSLGSAGRDAAKEAIDAARHKRPNLAPAGGLAAALSDSRARKESMLLYMDLVELRNAATAGPAVATPEAPPARAGKVKTPVKAAATSARMTDGMSVGVGFGGGAAHIRASLPASVVVELGNTPAPAAP